ncbi:MAG TPA: protein kinase [Ktedonobacteraceae bacterium]
MQDPLLGYQLGNYRLVQVLGQGSFAQVYRGQHVHLGVFTAVKVLHAQLGELEKQNFHKEAVLLTTLKHAHIIRFLDYGFISGRPYLITDLAERGSLNKMHPRGTRVSMSQIINYVSQIAEGLDFAHGLHIVHRDIKPENILVGDAGELLLADFGIAKLMGTTGSYLTSSMSGTLPYMAPELFDGRPSPPSDQYALGIMVYEWLTGRFPFEGTAGELIKHHLQDTPPPVRFFNPAVSLEIEQVVLTTLKKEPTQRFRTMQAFANALRQASDLSLGVQQPSQALQQIRPPLPSDPGFPPGQPGQPNIPPQWLQPPPPGGMPVSPGASFNMPLSQRLPPPPAQARVANPQSRPPTPNNPGPPVQAQVQMPSDPAARVAPPVSTGPTQAQATADSVDWQKLMPPPQALAFGELPGLPQAALTDYWWPTFLIPPEQRRKINEGTITSETLRALGPLASFPSLSIQLPVSNSAKPLSIGKLDAAQRISDTSGRISSMPRPSNAPQQVGKAPISTGGRVAPAQGGSAQGGGAQGPVQQAVQVQAPMPKPTGRTAQAAKPGGSSTGTAGRSTSRGTTVAVFTIVTLAIALICTIAGANGHVRGAIIASWILLGISFSTCIVAMSTIKQNKALHGWMIFFFLVIITLLFSNIGVYNSVNAYCYNYC